LVLTVLPGEITLGAFSEAYPDPRKSNQDYSLALLL